MCHECLNKDICPTGQSPPKSPVKTTKGLSENKSNKDKSPKEKKITPKKYKIEQNIEMNDFIERTSDSNIKIKQKITPKKEKIEPKQDMNTLIEITSDSNVKSKAIKKQVKPKKEEIEQNDDANNFIEKTSDLIIKTKSNTKKVTPKKEKIVQDDEMNDFKEKTLTVSTKIVKKSPRKRKSNPPNEAIEMTTDLDAKKNTKVTKTNKQKAAKKDILATEQDSEIKVKRTRQRTGTV